MPPHASRQPKGSPLPRAVDAGLAALLLLVALPLLLGIALALRCRGGPVWFVQTRLGYLGRSFAMVKFATHTTTAGASVTTSIDPRVPRLRRWLRHWRLDELPQLLHVLRGDLALVGPRPEVPANLAEVAPADLAAVQSVRPGLTGPVQLAFAGEGEVLAGCADPVAVYRRVLVPWKVRLDRRLLARRSWRGDLWVLLGTPWRLVDPRERERSRMRVRRRIASAARRDAPTRLAAGAAFGANAAR